VPDRNVGPTDCRRRPDQRYLENGDLNVASAEKFRLEEKQRAARKIREDRLEEYHPRWFTMQNGAWMYSGGYWEAREERNFTGCPDIY
jgi:hypothetical protein